MTEKAPAKSPREQLKETLAEEKTLREKRLALRLQLDESSEARNDARQAVKTNRELVAFSLVEFKKTFNSLNSMITRGKANPGNIAEYKELTAKLLDEADSFINTTSDHQASIDDLLEQGG